MNRLTYKNPNGTWGMNNGYDMTKVPSKLYGALYKLKDYEETGLSPEQIIQLDEIYLEKCEEINKLKKEIKEKEEEFTIDTNVGNKDGWISVDERLPEEHDSIFKERKGTDKWKDAMFEKTSDEVIVTVEYENGERRTKTTHTIDGEWNTGQSIVPFKVIAWQPLPAPYKAEGEQ